MIKPITKTNLNPLIVHWIGDSDVDKEKTDINKYLESGDCVVKPNGNPAKITIKELTYSDIMFIYDYLGLKPEDFQAKNVFQRTLTITVARLAIQQIEGLPLKFENKAGNRMLIKEDADALLQCVEIIKDNGKEDVLSLIDWIGGMAYQRAIFRQFPKR